MNPLLAGGLAAVLFGVYADTAYNAYSATNSSPQTTELFARDRSDTLQKYVNLGHLQVVALAGVGAGLLWVTGHKALALWPIIGAGTVAIAMQAMYSHALRVGGAH